MSLPIEIVAIGERVSRLLDAVGDTSLGEAGEGIRTRWLRPRTQFLSRFRIGRFGRSPVVGPADIVLVDPRSAWARGLDLSGARLVLTASEPGYPVIQTWGGARSCGSSRNEAKACAS